MFSHGPGCQNQTGLQPDCFPGLLGSHPGCWQNLAPYRRPAFCSKFLRWVTHISQLTANPFYAGNVRLPPATISWKGPQVMRAGPPGYVCRSTDPGPSLCLQNPSQHPQDCGVTRRGCVLSRTGMLGALGVCPSVFSRSVVWLPLPAYLREYTPPPSGTLPCRLQEFTSHH